VRNLKKDLEIYKGVTQGKWSISTRDNNSHYIEHSIFSDDDQGTPIATDMYKRDADFLIAAHEGFAEVIERAIAAEAEVEKLRKQRTEDIELMEETVEAQKLALATIIKLRKALALAHSMILGGEQHTEQSRQVIEGALGLR